MRKLFALYINELIKISKKISVLIILILMVIGIVGFGALLKYQSSMNLENQTSPGQQQYLKDEEKRQFESTKSKISDLEKMKSTAKTEQEKEGIELQLMSEKNNLEMREYAKSKKINLVDFSNNYLESAVYELYENKLNEKQYKDVPEKDLTSEEKEKLANAKNFIPRLESVINNKDHNEYLKISSDRINANKSLSAGEKKIHLEMLQLESKLQSDKRKKTDQEQQAAMGCIQTIRNGKLSLLNNLDQTTSYNTMKPLTDKSRAEIKKIIAINEYRINNDILPRSQNDLVGESFGILTALGLGIIAILMMILAGGSISSEMSTGSIKSLIISPTKRWKIFAAKFLSLFTMILLCSTLVYIVVVLVNGVLFGFTTNNPYLYVSNGVVHEINFYVHQFLSLLLNLVSVLVFTVLALTLSTVTRNTAVSVSVSLAVYLVGGIINIQLLRFFNGEWQKFSPLNNLDLNSKIFPNNSLSELANSMDTVNNSLTFTIVYIAVLLMLLLYTGLDSFKRRDIN